MHTDVDWQAVEGVLSKDMATIGKHLQTWKLNLSTAKMVSTAFHLNKKETKCELKVNFNNEALPFCSEPKYLGVTLGRSLTYRRHLAPLGKTLTSRVALLRRLAGLGLCSGETTLRIATSALVHSIAEYCASARRRSAHTHLINPVINDALQTVAECLHPRAADNFPILAGIHPAELRRKEAKMSLARRTMEPGHLLHSALTCPPGGNARHLKSRHVCTYQTHNS